MSSETLIRDSTWQLQKKATVMDIHTHALLNHYYLGKSPMRKHTRPLRWNPLQNQIDIPRAWDAEVNVLAVVSYAIHNPIRDCGYFPVTQRQLAVYHEWVGNHQDLVQHVLTSQDIREAKSQGKMAVFAAVEGAHCLDANIDHMSKLAESGVRYLTLAHFLTNHFAACCSDPNPPFPGLSRLGKELIDEMNRLRILIDVSHLSEAGFWEVMELAQVPVIASHSGLRKTCDISRNLSDKQIKAIVDNGGVVGMCLWPWYLKKHGLWVGIEAVVRNIQHCVDVGGPESVCLGSDMDGFIWLPREMRDISDLPILTQALLDAGIHEDMILGFLGENFLKVMDRAFGTK